MISPSRKLKPNSSDVLCGRGGQINNSTGNVRFREMVVELQSEYFHPETRKSKKAVIVQRIINQVQALNPPGRFLKKDATTRRWVEISEQKARKKVGQAFRDVVGPEDRSTRLLSADERSTGTASNATPSALEGVYGVEQPSSREGSPGLPLSPPTTYAETGQSSPTSTNNYRSATNSPRIEMNFSNVSTAPKEYETQQRDYSASSYMHTSNASHDARKLENTGPYALHHPNEKPAHKISRLPISDFSSYSLASSNNMASTSRSHKQDEDANSAVSDLEKLTIDMLVKRARIWEDMYYSEREYSKRLEDHLVAVLGARSRLPKRRRIGDQEAPLAA